MTAEYRKDETTGRYQPGKLTEGPCLDEPGSCRIGHHLTRERKEEPGHPLWVGTCHEHGGYFTVYPPGFAPYARLPIVPPAADRPQASTSEAQWRGSLAGSLLASAADASEGALWHPRPGEAGVHDTGRSTQARHVRRAAVLTGLDPRHADSDRQRFADALGVDTLLLIEQAPASKSDGLQVRANAVMNVVCAMRNGSSLFERFAASGFLSGLWGKPYRQDPGARSLRPLFRGSGTPVGDRPQRPPEVQREGCVRTVPG